MRGAVLFAALALAGCAKPIAVDLADLERAFDVDSAAAMQKYGGRRLQVRARIASVHDDRVTLDSAYLLNVQAYFWTSTAGLSEGEATLVCNKVEPQEYPTGAKPKLSGCSLA